MASETKRYRYVGTHAEILASGRPIAPGEFVDLSDDDVRESHTEMLIADGRLIGADSDAEHQAKLASTRVSRRSSVKSEEQTTGEEG